MARPDAFPIPDGVADHFADPEPVPVGVTVTQPVAVTVLPVAEHVDLTHPRPVVQPDARPVLVGQPVADAIPVVLAERKSVADAERLTDA